MRKLMKRNRGLDGIDVQVKRGLLRDDPRCDVGRTRYRRGVGQLLRWKPLVVATTLSVSFLAGSLVSKRLHWESTDHRGEVVAYHQFLLWENPSPGLQKWRGRRPLG